MSVLYTDWTILFCMKILAVVQNKTVCMYKSHRLRIIIRECVLILVSCFHMDQIDHAVCRPLEPVYQVVAVSHQIRSM